MIDSEKLFRAFELEYQEKQPSVPLAKYFAQRYEDVQRVERKRYSLEKELLRIKEELKQRQNNVQRELRQLQSDCKHECTTFHPDASGNNDSFTNCDICGDEV